VARVADILSGVSFAMAEGIVHGPQGQ
jgi:hypothetical protein